MKITSLILSIIIFFAVPVMSFGTDPAAVLLDEAASRISAVLHDADKSLSETAGSIGRGLTGQSSLRGDIQGLCTGKTYAIDCSFINAKGIMEIVEPEKYRKYEGTNLSGQAIVVQISKAKRPVFSKLFVGVEGTEAILLRYPVFNVKNEFIGSVGIYFTPDVLIKQALKGLKIGEGTNILVLQEDGTNLFSSDPAQLMRNVFKDAEYQAFPELKELVRHIVSREEGTDFYRYAKPGTYQVVKKRAIWKTISLYDNFWRVVVTQQERP